MVEPTHLKNISQIGWSPQVGVKIKNVWNHHLVNNLLGKFQNIESNHILSNPNKVWLKRMMPSIFKVSNCQWFRVNIPKQQRWSNHQHPVNCKFLEDLQSSVFLGSGNTPPQPYPSVPPHHPPRSRHLQHWTPPWNEELQRHLTSGRRLLLKLLEIPKVLQVIKVTDTPRKSFWILICIEICS